ncbi:MAG: SH3 domain-containing protein [Bacteroidales bacterium]|nr:SH3 domain-containing protein [Bacteroidales bacterium]
MKKKVVLSVLLYIIIMPLFGQNYIQIIKYDANIRLKPSSSSVVITQALNGNIFKLINEKDAWFEILIFSGEYRYIHKSLCKKTDYVISLPESEQLRKTVFLELLNGEDKAQRVADKNYPNDIYKNIDYARSLNDKYKLDVLNKFGLQPPIYSKIILEGIKKKWN